MKQRLLSFLLLASFFFTACNPDDNNNHNSTTDAEFAENFGSAVARDFIGRVVDMDNHALQNVTVKIGSSTVQTDVNGVFIINGADVHEKFAYITATKSGFIDGSRSMVPTTGKNNVKIMLIPSTPLQTISSGQSSDVTLPSGTKVVFDGAFQDEDGNAYSGDVNVSMFHLLPSDENIGSLMPGMLYAKGEDGDAKVLETFGMLNVELRGSGGQKLQIKDGHTAQITMHIDDSQMGTAPSTIPLWHFDEAVGYWKQDGTATKQGNNYVGNVSHFSWWNCDTFSSTVSLTVTITDTSGVPIANAGVGLVVVSSNFTSYINPTNTNGQVSGVIPANETILLTVYDMCGIAVDVITVGPFATDTVLPPITIAVPQTQISKVSGTFKKCDGSLINNGYVYFEYGNNGIVTPVTNGDFSFTSIVCNDLNFELEGVDFDNIQTTGKIGYVFRSPETKVGSLQACNSASEFVQYRVDDNPMVTITTGITTSSSQYFNLIASSTIGEGFFAFSSFGPINAPGIYTTSTFQCQGSSMGQFGTFYILNSNPNTIVFNVNKYGGIGEYVDITFEGLFPQGTGGPMNQYITGVIHVKRDN